MKTVPEGDQKQRKRLPVAQQIVQTLEAYSSEIKASYSSDQSKEALLQLVVRLESDLKRLKSLVEE